MPLNQLQTLTPTFSNRREVEEFHQAKIISGYQDIVIEGCVSGIDVIGVSIFTPDTVNLCAEYT